MKRPIAIGIDEIELSEEESDNMVGTDEFKAKVRKLQLVDSMRQSVKSLDPTMSCELGSHGIKLNKEGYEISTTGMKDISSG
jgi:L,D-peptidoglycan transpeptidase YkuD (ErfK/YbiS/YcfS/YnhG family)